MTKQPNGAILWRGPSELDGAPIVLIATGLANGSNNAKTGDLVQTWILREDVSPTDAVNTGADASICGSCPHRGMIENGKNVGRSCYVTVFQAPLNVWKSYHRGIYPQATPETLVGRKVRLGAYGDPAAVPASVWAELLAQSLSGTGYTHQWRTSDRAFAQWLMASCDDQKDALDAARMGYRTFRVTALDSRQDRMKGEVICPASEEAGKKTQCAACLACGGLGSKAKANIVITVHGSAAKVNAAKARLAA
jgi:hypothetical protein